MRVAIPVTDELTIFKSNPCSAPKYCIFTILQEQRDFLTMTLDKTVKNLHLKEAESLVCSCCADVENSMEHRIWHYTIVESIQGCDYLLVKDFCKNTQHTLNIAGIKLLNIPSIIQDPQLAIKNFIIGERLAYNIQHVHYAS